MERPAVQIPTIATSRLILEPMSMEHSQGVFEMWRHPAVQKYSGPAQDVHGDEIQLPAVTNDDSDKLIRFWIAAADDGWGFRWVLLSKEERSLIGQLGYNSLSACSEIAFHMNPRYWGQGFMTEAAGAAIRWRKSGGAREVEAFIEPKNVGSVSLAVRLGMIATDTFVEGAQRYRMALLVNQEQ